MTNHPNRKVDAGTVAKLRALYQAAWGRKWPHDDSYIRELWLEARGDIPNGGKVPPPEVYERCVEAMRENHSF